MWSPCNVRRLPAQKRQRTPKNDPKTNHKPQRESKRPETTKGGIPEKTQTIEKCANYRLQKRYSRVSYIDKNEEPRKASKQASKQARHKTRETKTSNTKGEGHGKRKAQNKGQKTSQNQSSGSRRQVWGLGTKVQEWLQDFASRKTLSSKELVQPNAYKQKVRSNRRH